MQEVQKYGQPPVEIVRAIAPGLVLGEKGERQNLMYPSAGDEECCMM